MFTPYIMSKELVEPRISEIQKRKNARKQKKIDKCINRQETDMTTTSELSAISSATSFTPYIVSREHTEPRMAELKDEHEQQKKKSTKKQEVSPWAMNASSIPKHTKFAPYITSNHHVAASIAERNERVMRQQTNAAGLC